MRLLGALDSTDGSAPPVPSAPAPPATKTLAPTPVTPPNAALSAPRRTVRQVLEGAALGGSATARATLEQARIPDDCVLVFEWWTELHRQRGAHGFGLNPISWVDVDAWLRVTQRRVSPHDLDLILLGDAHYLLGLDKGLPEDDDAQADRPLWGEDGEDLHRPELVALDVVDAADDERGADDLDD